MRSCAPAGQSGRFGAQDRLAALGMTARCLAVAAGVPQSVQHARDRQGEFVDRRFELRAVLGGDLEAAAHRSDRGVELAAAGIFEGFAGPEQRLLADDAEAANFLHARVAVGDDPVAGNDLRGDGADVLEGDRIGENVTLAGRIGLIGDELRNGARRDLVFLAFGHGGPDPWVSLALHTKAAREASAISDGQHKVTICVSR